MEKRTDRSGTNNPMHGKKGKDNPNYGRKHSDEAKEKISKALKGKMVGESNPMYGKKHLEETLEKISKAVVQLDMQDNVIATYVSAMEAERATGIDNRSIGKVCTGLRKSAGKFKWRYK